MTVSLSSWVSLANELLLEESEDASLLDTTVLSSLFLGAWGRRLLGNSCSGSDSG